MSTRARHIAFTLLLALCQCVHAEDAALTRLRDTLAPLKYDQRGKPGPGNWEYHVPSNDLREASPTLDTAKQLLRDWIEQRLAQSNANVDERALAARLNEELSRANLFCWSTAKDDAPDHCKYELHDWDPVGFVFPEIELSRPRRGVLVVRAGLGILCGTDMSAYAYEWRDSRWQRFWQSEQPIVDGVEYRPQYIDGVRVSEADKSTGARLVMTLGNYTWCQSNWYPAYFRVWRASRDGSAKLLFDAEEPAFLGYEPIMTGSVRVDGFHFEYYAGSIDHGNTMTRTVTRHYRVSGNAVTRIEPIATDPFAFVDEWLARPWDESRHYVVADNVSAFAELHARLRSGHANADEPDVRRCSKGKELWQVGLNLELDGKPLGTHYFIVAWRPPQHFDLVAVELTQRVGCTGGPPGSREFASR